MLGFILKNQFWRTPIKNFILRITEIIYLKDCDDSDINKNSFDETFPILERIFGKEALQGFEKDKFPLVYVIISLY